MELGRNEKCHCKSGKKYKKCCYEKDKLERLETLKKEDYKKQSIGFNSRALNKIKKNFGNGSK